MFEAKKPLFYNSMTEEDKYLANLPYSKIVE
jgi:hypothetical protein